MKGEPTEVDTLMTTSAPVAEETLTFPDETLGPLHLECLMEYILGSAQSNRALLRSAIPEVTLEGELEAAYSGTLIFEERSTARVAMLAADAMYQMLRDAFPDNPEEWEHLQPMFEPQVQLPKKSEKKQTRGDLSPEAAVVLVKTHRGVRAASRATGIGRSRLSRLIQMYGGVGAL